MIWITLAGLAFLFALIPAALYFRNVRLFRMPDGPENPLPPVSILIPARDEAGGIRAAIDAALLTRGIAFEIIVLDDHSADDTASIARSIAELDPRVRLANAPELPAGWCGKQHACFTLSKLANYPLFCFVDADVRLEPECVARMAAFLQTSGAALVSGFPRQTTETFLERLLIPLIHFLLLGFLPLARMRRSSRPSLGAGCGQLFLTTREAYEQTGGHQQVRASLHDGLTLPRAFREQGLKTDLCDITYLATCRMYRSAREVWNGLSKNAREGLASPRLIVPATLMLLLGQVLPLAMLLHFVADLLALVVIKGHGFDSAMAVYQESGMGLGLALAALAVIAAHAPRFDAVVRFRQPMESALLHTFGIIALLVIQWRALIVRPTRWKGRSYPPQSSK
jgi:glycosyltransferase involved in cell wall biosynthesis